MNFDRHLFSNFRSGAKVEEGKRLRLIIPIKGLKQVQKPSWETNQIIGFTGKNKQACSTPSIKPFQ
jgi:hypothetical protein